MRIGIEIEGRTADGDVFLAWTPRKVELTLSEIPPGTGSIALRVSSTGPVAGLTFTVDGNTARSDTLDLTLDPAQPSASFFVAGAFESPSVGKNDAEMTVASTNVNPPVEIRERMTVRVRKNAAALTVAERERFLLAYAKLHDQPGGLYDAFREMHLASSDPNIHRDSFFLPWHRGYVLDLERELQSIDPLVTLPYWNFGADTVQEVLHPDVFDENFLGRTSESSAVVFAASNPLFPWSSRAGSRFRRQLRPQTLGNIKKTAATLGIGSVYAAFAHPDDGVEGDPHGAAHVSFAGEIGSIATAPRDPLFFLLHCNVDRLWALWQNQYERYDATDLRTYPHPGSSPNPFARAKLTMDTMWPWDGRAGQGQRPPSAPGGPLPDSPSVTAPGPTPTIGSMIDYQGKANRANALGYDYDDVPYW